DKSYDYDEQGKLINKKDESPYNIKNETANPDSPSAEESLSGKTMDGRPITIRKLETDEKGLELEDYEAQGMNLHSVAVEINIGDKKLIGISRPISSGNNASQAAYDLALYINQKVGKQIINVADTFTYSTKNRDLYTFEKYPDDSSETQKILSVVGDIYVFDFIIANNRVKYDLVTRNGIDYLINNGTAFPENLESNDQLFISFVKKMQQEDRFLTIEMKKFISEADLSEILVIIANSVIDLNQRTLLVERIQSLKSILNIFPYRPSTQAAVITDPPKNATPKAAQQSGTGYSPQQEKVAIDTILAEPKEYSSQQEVLNYIRITDEAFFNKILENVDSKNIKAFLDKLSKQIFESEVNVAEVTNKLYEIPNNKLNQYVNNYLVAPNNPFVVRTLFSETHNFFSKQLENLPINLIKKNALIEKMTKEVVEHNSNSSSMLYDFDSLPYYKQLEFINAYLKSNELFNKVIEEFKPAPKTNKDLIFLSGSSKLETPVLERTHESVYKELFDRSKLLKELLTSDPELAKEFADLLAENIAENAQIGIMNSKNEIVPLLASQVSMNNIIRNLDKLMKDDLVYLLRTTEEHDHSMLLWEVAGDISLKEEEDDGISVDLMLNFCKKLQAEMLQDNSFHIQTIIRKLNLMNKHDRERFMQLILSPENDVAILEFISSDYMLEFTYKLSANEINKKFLANKELILRFIELGQEECSKMRGFFEILSKAMAEEGLTERIVDNSINGLLDLKKWPDSALRHEVNIVLDPDWWTARKSLGLLGKIIKYHQ
ncbi:MAG: hypothetical protein WCP89_03045, partial [archaeon]